jgi:peroxiredoxin
LQVYQKYLPEMRALGATLLAISPQTPDNSLTTAEKNALEFEVLSDAGNAVARRFGLVFALDESLHGLYSSLGARLPEVNGDDSWELPIPGTFVIGRDGVVTLAYVDADYTHRLEPADILASLRAR